MGKSQQKQYDVIVIGGGPAGVSTALYAARGGLSVALIHNGVSALAKAEHIQNYYGVGTVTGADLYARGIAQADALGAEVISEQVTFATTDGKSFTVSTPNGERHSKKLVIATGAPRRSINIPGLSEFEGRGVSYCAVCDAFFYRNKRVGVIGAGEYAAHEYAALKNVVGEVVLLTNGETPMFAVDRVITTEIDSVFGRNGAERATAAGDATQRLGGVRFADGTELELDGLFVAVGILSGNALGRALGVFTDKSGALIVDGRGMTNVDGLYAAGDCTPGVKQIAKAAADGVTVGLSLIADIKGNKNG